MRTVQHQFKNKIMTTTLQDIPTDAEQRRTREAFSDLVVSLKQCDSRAIASAIQTALYREDVQDVRNELNQYLEQSL